MHLTTRTPMMDEVVADPAGKQLWGGNEGGLFRMVPIERVVEDIVNGIERRSRKIVTPRSNAAPVALPGVMGRVVDLIGFRGDTVPSAERRRRTGAMVFAGRPVRFDERREVIDGDRAQLDVRHTPTGRRARWSGRRACSSPSCARS